MGLRIETNIGALTALRRQQSDRPGGVGIGDRVISGFGTGTGFTFLAQLRPELTPISRSVENTQAARSLISAADGGLEAISGRIAALRSSFLTARNAGPGADLQGAVDSGLGTIDRIASGVRLGGRRLLGGDLGFSLEKKSPELELVDVQGGEFAGGFPQPVTVNVTDPATRARADGTIAAVQTQGGTIRLQGPGGAEELAIPAGAAQADVIRAINGLTSKTGVEATPEGVIQTKAFGTDANLDLRELSGRLEGITPGVSHGADVVAQVNGATVAGRGNTITADTPDLSAVIQVRPDAQGRFSFTIASGGQTFQLGPLPGGADDVTVGLGAVGSSTLGRTSGLGGLRSLAAGGANSIANNPAGGLSVLDAAAREVSGLRSRLGSREQRLFASSERSLTAALERFTGGSKAEFADEIANGVRQRLVQDSGLVVPGSATLTAGQALRLLI